MAYEEIKREFPNERGLFTFLSSFYIGRELVFLLSLSFSSTLFQVELRNAVWEEERSFSHVCVCVCVSVCVREREGRRKRKRRGENSHRGLRREEAID